MAAVNSMVWWREWAGGIRLHAQDVLRAVSLVVLAGLLALLAIGGGGRDLVSWTEFRLALLGLFVVFMATGHIRRVSLTYPVTAMVAAVIVTSIWSVTFQSSIEQVISWVTYAAVLFITASAITRPKWARRFVDATMFIGGVLVLIGLFWFWGNSTPMMRWYSTFYWPNPFAGFLLLLLPVETLRCVLASSRREALAHGAMVVLLGTAFVLTFSRGAWLVAAITAILGAVFLGRSLRLSSVARAAAVLGVTVAAVFLLTRGQAFRSSTAGVLTRAASTTDLSEYSLQGRLNFWRGALEIFRDHPLRGTGPGTYARVYPQYQRDVRFFAQDPHNLFVQMAADTGIVGLAALFWLMIAFVALGSRIIRVARGTPEFSWVAGVVFGVGAFWVHTGVEMNWSFPAGPAMAFALMGVLAEYDSLTAAAARSEPSSPVGPQPFEGRRLRPMRTITAVGVVLLMVSIGLQYRAGAEFRAGRSAYAAGQWQAAAARFQRASELNPIDPRYPSALADARLKNGEPLSAVLLLVRRAQSLDRTNPYYWYQFALITGQESTPAAFHETERALRIVIALDPFHYPEAYRRLAALYRRQGDSTKALDVYDRAAARYPDAVAQDFVLRPRLWPGVLALFMDWADLLTEQGRDADAAELYARVARLEPRFVPAHVALVQMHLRAGRLRKAVEALEAALAQVPNDAQLQALRRELQARSK